MRFAVAALVFLLLGTALPLEDSLKAIEKRVETREKQITQKTQRESLKELRKQLQSARKMWKRNQTGETITTIVRIQESLRKKGETELVHLLTSWLLAAGAYSVNINEDSQLYHIQFSAPEGFIRIEIPVRVTGKQIFSGMISGSTNLYSILLPGPQYLTVPPDGSAKNFFYIPATNEITLTLVNQDKLQLVPAKISFPSYHPLPAIIPIPRKQGTNPVGELEEDTAEPLPIRLQTDFPYEEFLLPHSASAGSKVEIFGRFDGDFRNTRIMIGKQPCILLAETTKNVVVHLPSHVSGKQTLQIQERDWNIPCRFQVDQPSSLYYSCELDR